jgi:galactokinase
MSGERTQTAEVRGPRSAAAEAFARVFRRAPSVVASAPGRVNLIGEHTDYSGGFVLPMAIPQRTTVALARRDDDLARVVSGNIGEGAKVTFRVGHEERRSTWIDYVQGTVFALRRAGYVISGFDAFLESEVPVGSGLSSSAALEVSLLRALADAFGLPLDPVRIAVLGRAAENDFVGAPVGIMDQMASSLATETEALFLDTRSMHYERVALPDAVDLVVIDSGVSHGHAGGEYATRKSECERAAAALGVRELRDVDDAARAAVLEPPLDRRARHVVTENARVLETVDALRRGDVHAVGRLLDASHASLRDDFEVTTPDVDRLVALAQRDEATFGARMTGGGFGGAIVALAARGRGREAAARILRAYDEGGAPRGRVLLPTGTWHPGA